MVNPIVASLGNRSIALSRVFSASTTQSLNIGRGQKCDGNDEISVDDYRKKITRLLTGVICPTIYP